MRIVMAALAALWLLPGVALAETTTLQDLISQLDAAADEVATSAATRADFDTFVARHDLSGDDALYRDFVRVKVAFEATRAGGLWGLRWWITDREPQSDAIWSKWEGAGSAAGDTTAVAECDELSALFAFVAGQLGVDGVGLFWPTWNHTVAVWKLESREGAPVRVVLPTSQVFLDPEQTFDTDAFDPWTQRTIYTYGRRDAPADLALDSDLVERFVQRVRSHARASFATLQEQRNLREMLQGGLTGREDVQAYAERQALAAPTPDDAASWRAFLRDLQG